MAEARRIKPQEAQNRVQAGQALFICAYDSEDMCERMRLEGALTLGELTARLPGISKDQELIFYCK
ncbi:ArsR family transcriptional regulator [Geobacter sp. SVR]|uniref:rhodanese-like domain-containing protein n=1 Tax=Geobacter sp. SVR TaxID=2495594 RepID=UPI00143EF53D|nr:ArsR family transcriptional regulator [Geobacter sp. SVR]BCS55767.1 hypothetical protein GSVR_40750 [Geobacter sp. SVR]GCF83771.1 hypothetical protein GSbR_03710 [Geobacter sp. SVR]